MKRLRSADDDEEVLVLWLIRRRALPYRGRILVPDFHLDVLAMDDAEAKDQFRFTVGELTLLVHYLGLPKVVYTREGVRSNAIEALAIFLRRLMYPKR
ncbi:uncharacterized protein IUM83_06619 [Phytophthora cinnamomi]|uniref:uncharacterized protein n=1 Tax=Phytophthora cinnamomi TaxID=4785 RepID=UPI00355945DA|nr:hypothetical protein IUM83_06619 [Phytophthora cinnamomi]